MPTYDHANYVVIREKHITATGISAAAAGSEYVTTTFRVRNSSVVVGCAFRIGSGGSAAGTNSISVARINAAGTRSTWQTLTFAGSAGASGASAGRNTFDISLISAMTLTSIGDAAVLLGNAASTDKMVVLSDVIWRYRVLPGGDDGMTMAALG